jgi:ribonuclease G
MKNQIIIHAAANQTRVALIENGELAQLFIESPENQRTVGNIYLAEVHKVMAGIRAAFIDMGTQKDAFLHFSDTGEHLENYLIMLNGEDAIPKKALEEIRKEKNNGNGSVTQEQNRAGALLSPKQKVLVQIVKEPIGSKGPRVSTNITVAGRFLVLIPMGEYVAVSKRIRSQKERRRLRSCIASVLPDGFGVIVRTLAEGQSDEALHEDLKDVLDKWQAILDKLKEARPPALLHQDMDMTESLVRDLFAKDYSRILIDDAKIHRSIKSYVSRVAPNMVPNIELYKGSEHIFDYMKISRDVDSVFSPRVKMPSGGYLIFEQTEAMYVVDVNSGRYAAKRDQEENSLKTNLESAREIAKQLRLRDIGGIIVVDFIDLREDANRKKVYDELKREFRKDRAKTNVLPMSDFGLVQITRQRIRPSVVKSVSKVCPMCGGSGSIVSQDTVVADIESWLTKFKYNYKSQFTLDLHLNPYLRSMIQRGWISQRLKWLLAYRLNIHIMADDTLSMNDFKFMLPNSEIDITDVVLNDQPIEKAISEADLRSQNGSRKKSDDPGLDYFKKESRSGGDKEQDGDGRGQSRSDGKSGSGRSGSRGSQQRGRQQARKGPDTQQVKKQGGSQQSQRPGRDDDKASADSRKDQTAAKQQQTAQKSPVDEDGKDSKKEAAKKPSPPRPNPKAKYYKSSKDKDEDKGQSTGSQATDDQDQGQPERKESKKEDNEHLPSAVEVARQHRMEKEEQKKKDN